MAILSKRSPEGRHLLLALLLTFSGLGAQADIEAAIQQALAGNLNQATTSLSQLKSRYPNNGSVLFLEALVISDAEEAVTLYRRLISLYPNSPYADDAMLKVGEYLYARGLYVQAATQLKRIPVGYPRSDLIYPSIRMFLNALLVSGHKDTARFYAQVFSRKYPEIVFDLTTGRATSMPREMRGNRTPAIMAPAPTVTNTTNAQVEVARLQLGAFGERANALRLVRQLESLNYQVLIVERHSGGRNMYVVMAVGFISASDARMAGQLLKDNYDIDFLVVKSP